MHTAPESPKRSLSSNRYILSTNFNPGQARSRRRPSRVVQFGSLGLGRHLAGITPLLRRLAGGRNQRPAT